MTIQSKARTVCCYITIQISAILDTAQRSLSQLFVMFLRWAFLCLMAFHLVLCYSFNCNIRCSPRKGLREEFALRSTDEITAGEDQPSFFFSKKAFGAIGMKESMSGVVNSLNLNRPSKIQALSYNEILSGKTCILADQTGSGKTLAYLLPVIQRMIESKKNGTLGATVSKSPYILIIAPTTELARFDSLSLLKCLQ